MHQLEIVEWYKDDGVTGTLPLEMRPAGEKLLQDAKASKIDLLLIYKLDRLGRSARVVLNAVHELEQAGVKIRSMTEPFDTGDPSGRFLLTILAGVADLERETILDRMWHGANRAARAGKWLGGIVPYGYFVNDEGYLEINDQDLLPGTTLTEAGVVRLIYDLISNQKQSCIKVADYLNALGIPTHYSRDSRLLKKGKRKENTAGIWRPGRVREIIVNSTYKGIHQYGKRSKKNREIIMREVPAIVPEEIWEQAQEVLRDNQLESMRNAKRHYLLRSLIKCGTCGLTYNGNQYGCTKVYYVCNGKTAYRGPLQGKCTSKNIPQDWVEELVWNDCINFIMSPGEALKELGAAMEEKKSQKRDVESEKQMIIEALKEKEVEKQSILDLFRRKVINLGDVELQLEKIDIEKAALTERIKSLESLVSEEDSLYQRFNSAEELLMSFRSKIEGNPPFEVRREIVKSLVKEVIVETKIDEETEKPYASVTVNYNFTQGVTVTDKDCTPQPT